jgi:predicted peroxiredoxin
MANATKRLQILITAGAEDPHKARQGLEAALSAVALGVDVIVFMTLRGAFWVRPHLLGDCVVPGCESIPDLLKGLIEQGAKVVCCPACAVQFVGSCDVKHDLLAGVEMGGLTAMVAETASGTPTITF